MAQDPYFLSCYYYSAMGRPINPLSRPHVTMINMEKPHTRVSKCFNPAHIAQLSCTKDRWEGTPSWKKLWQMLNFFLTFKFITKGKKKENKTKQNKKNKKSSTFTQNISQIHFSFLSLKLCYSLLMTALNSSTVQCFQDNFTIIPSFSFQYSVQGSQCRWCHVMPCRFFLRS